MCQKLNLWHTLINIELTKVLHLIVWLSRAFAVILCHKTDCMDIKKLYELYKQHPVITTDSRDCPEGSIFFALKGESFDGNKFAVSALEKGCAYAVVDDKQAVALAGGSADDGRLLFVDDVLQTFKDLSREHRRQFNIPVIGITGTNGKTTNKELIAAVLGKKYNVLFTLGNFNNDVGVPKTLFRMTPEHDIDVVEMGASHPGDIKTLVETVEPTCGLITNVGRAHLQGFGSFKGVKATKGELYDYMATAKSQEKETTNAFVFLNTKDTDLCQMAEERKVRTLPYVNGRVAGCNPFLVVELEGKRNIRTHLIGTYNLANILAAVTVGRYFGVSDDDIQTALEEYQPSNNRSQLTVTAQNKLIVDAYNANPTSMAAAIENFRLMAVDEPKLAILGDMRELGISSEAEHQKIADILAYAGFKEVWLVGEEFGKTECAFRKFHDVEEVKTALHEAKPHNHYILIKGSNGIRLNLLTDLL